MLCSGIAGRLAAILLAVSLIVGFFGRVSETAADLSQKDVIRYVSLGDSAANGYGFADYYTADGQNRYGYLMEASEAYPSLFKNALREKYGCDVELTQLAMSAMRTAELRILLDGSFEPDDYSRLRFTDPAYSNRFNLCGGEDAAREMFVSAIRDADIITFNLGNNDFDYYVASYLNNIMGTSDKYYTDGLCELLPGAARGAAVRVKDAAEDLLSGLPGFSGENGRGATALKIARLPRVLAYCFASFVQNYSADIDLIYRLNPDVNLIVVGIGNGLDGIKLEVADGAVIDIGALWGAMIDAANCYICRGDPHAGEYLYTNADSSTFLDEIAAGEISPALDKWVRGSMGTIPESRYAEVCSVMKKAAGDPVINIGDCLANLSWLGGIQNEKSLDTALEGGKMFGALHIYYRLIYADGVSCHPDAAGHRELCAAILAALETRTTGWQYWADHLL